jgi:predicted nucleic acid-binding protein
VSTRPQKDNGFGKTVAETDRYCRFLESFLTVLPETPALFARWRELAVDHEVSGKKVHDARLVAAMSVHRIRLILTFNTKDFVRYKDVEAVRPEEV